MENSNENRKSKPSMGYFLILVTLLLVITFSAAIVKNNTAEAMKGQLNDVYTRSFLQLTDCVKDIDTLLSKCVVTNSPYALNDLSNEIYQKASFAQANLGELPISHVEIDNTAKFLTQVGDYTYSISKKGFAARNFRRTRKNSLKIWQNTPPPSRRRFLKFKTICSPANFLLIFPKNRPRCLQARTKSLI